jgi:hypothetical protein
MKTVRIIPIVVVFSFWMGNSLAQPAGEVKPITRLNGNIQLDGIVDEASWLLVDPLPLTMHWPVFKGDITESSEIRVAYDDENIYVGAICYDSDPSKIQVTTFQRDNWGEEDDQVAIILDPYNDNENSLVFAVTVTGSRIDAVIKNDSQGDDPVSLSWNSYWEAASTRDNRGWQAEMKIPFSSLRFQEENGSVEMGMIAYRYIARKHELNSFPAIPADWGFWSFTKASQAQTVSFQDVKNERPWYISPYGLVGLGHHHQADDNGVYDSTPDRIFQPGLDLQHALTDNLNADFTLFTDFAQVEADNQVVNLSRFSLFFPEKRKFFLERASIFDFQTDLNNNMFYSRRIGINDGEMIPLWGGIRLVGRMDSWDVGFLTLQSRETGNFASENFGVLRLRKNVFNQRSYLGGMMTSRFGLDGKRNIVYGIDGIINMFRQDYLQVNLAQSWDTGDSASIAIYDRSRMYLMWEKRIINGFGYRFSYSSVGQNYIPGLGFEQRYNFSQFGDRIFYSWFAPEKSSLRQTVVTLHGGISLNNSTHEPETSTLALESRWAWKRGSGLTVKVENLLDNVPAIFNLSDTDTITPGRYSNSILGITHSSAPVGMFQAETNLKAGTFYGGNLGSISLSTQVIFSKYFEMLAFYEYSHIKFPKQDDPFVSHVARLNMTASLNVKLSLSGFVQLNSLQGISSLNFRLRYNPIDGNDLYLVYNEVLNNHSRQSLRNHPLSDSRNIMIKYIHTFRL